MNTERKLLFAKWPRNLSSLEAVYQILAYISSITHKYLPEDQTTEFQPRTKSKDAKLKRILGNVWRREESTKPTYLYFFVVRVSPAC